MHQARADAMKALEDFFLIFFRDAYALIADGYRHPLVTLIDAQGDVARRAGILHRIVEQVHQRLGHGVGIHRDARQVGRRFKVDRELILLQAHLEDFQRVGDQFANVRRIKMITLLPRFDARKIEDVIDQLRQPPAFGFDVFAVLAHLRRVFDAAQFQELAEDANRSQRRAQLV